MAEKFCIPGVTGEAVGARGKVSVLGLQGGWGGDGWLTVDT